MVEEKEILNLATELVNYHVPNFKVVITNKKTELGFCNYRLKLIGVSKHLGDAPIEKIRETVLHEIAHALTPTDKGHGHLWASECRRLGIEPRRLSNFTPKGAKWKMTCTNGCDWVAQYFRKPNIKLEDVHCKFCKSDIQLLPA